jgi:hypothetical protein
MPLQRAILAFALILVFGSGVRAEEHRLDAFAKTITPFLGIFAENRKTPNRAFRLKVRIEQGTDIPAALSGVVAEMTVQVPDQLRISGPVLGETFTLVRDGEKVWISPGGKARALLDGTIAGKDLPPAEKGFKLGAFKLPFNDKELNFLPALFSVKDLGYQTLDGVECRVEDVTLMPELAKSLESGGWVARLWITPDHKPMRLTIARKGWNIVLRFDEVKFAKELPEETWKPTPEQAGDVLRLETKEYSRFLRGINRLTAP